MKRILVTEAHALGAIGAIRSLGRAGYHVHAVSARDDALGLKSRFAARAVVCPDYDDAGYLDWLDDYLKRNAIDMIVPSDAFIDAVRPRFKQLSALLPLSNDADVVYRPTSKIDVFEAYSTADPAAGLLDHHPASLIVDRTAPPAVDALAGLGAADGGLFLKADRRYGRDGADAGVWYARDAEEAHRRLTALLEHYDRLLVQAACDGVQAGVCLLMVDGAPRAISCVHDVHRRPHSKGTMSLRRSWSCANLVADAIARLRHLGWQGCAMVEYRRDPATDGFNVIEINARYWQSLHLDLYSGVDFPKLQADWFFGASATPRPHQRMGVLCRDTWPGEVAHVTNELRHPDATPAQKLGAVAMFFLRFLDPRVRQDLMFPGDRGLYWRRLRRFLAQEGRALYRRLRGGAPVVKQGLKAGFLQLIKAVGGFRLARHLTRSDLRILCYHGIWLGDGHYGNYLFMAADTFADRMARLRKLGLTVLGLDEAVARRRDGTLPDRACVITIDDGWTGTYRHMLPVLESAGLPATLYLYSEPVVRGEPVYNVAVRYLLARAPRRQLDLSGLDDALSGSFELDDDDQREAAAEAIVSAIRAAPDGAARRELCDRLGDRLDVAFDALADARLFHLMTPDEIADWRGRGLDIQLHTHRHHLDLDDPDQLGRELADNRAVLEPLAGRPLTHFCYPSGRYVPALWPALEAAGIASATTTDQGLVAPDAPVYALNRLMDGEDIPAIEFEAELSGVMELARRLRRRAGR